MGRRSAVRSIPIAATLLVVASLGLGLVAPANASIDNVHHLNVNAVDCVITNHDSYGFDIESGGYPGLIWPRGTTNAVLFAAGLWVGAVMDNNTAPTVKVGEYSSHFGPGPMQ